MKRRTFLGALMAGLLVRPGKKPWKSEPVRIREERFNKQTLEELNASFMDAAERYDQIIQDRMQKVNGYYLVYGPDAPRYRAVKLMNGKVKLRRVR